MSLCDSHSIARTAKHAPSAIATVRTKRSSCFAQSNTVHTEEIDMSKPDDNKAIVGRWFDNFWGAADLIAEGDYVVARWEGGGTHRSPAFSDFLAGS